MNTPKRFGALKWLLPVVLVLLVAFAAGCSEGGSAETGSANGMESTASAPQTPDNTAEATGSEEQSSAASPSAAAAESPAESASGGLSAEIEPSPSQTSSPTATAKPTSSPTATAKPAATSAEPSTKPVPTPKPSAAATPKPSAKPSASMGHETHEASQSASKEPQPTSAEPTASPVRTPEPSESAESQTVVVEIKDFAFVPGEITVTKGTTVKFINRDKVKHTATADDGSFDTGLFGKDEVKEVEFKKAGTFTYYCAPHPGMTGAITVTD